MNIDIIPQTNPNQSELQTFFEKAFTYNPPEGTQKLLEDNQTLNEWFTLDEMIRYLNYGRLFEARDELQTLVGAIFIAIEHPLTWPDGQKMEIFILAVEEKYRQQGIAKRLIEQAEVFATQNKAKKIIINAHASLSPLHQFYINRGYQKIGTLTDYYANGDALFLQKDL